MTRRRATRPMGAKRTKSLISLIQLSCRHRESVRRLGHLDRTLMSHNKDTQQATTESHFMQ
jgi:hypothetical protein